MVIHSTRSTHLLYSPERSDNMINRDKIDGIEVVERQGATQTVSFSETPVRLSGVDYVLLADGTERYQCVMTNDCADAFEKATSARAHLVKHSAKRELKRRDAVNARRGNGVKSVATKNARQAAVEGENGTEFLIRLADQLEATVPLLRYMAKARTEQPDVDADELAQLRAKAEKWDQAQSLFGRR